MNRLTDEQLRQAHAARDWHTLWLQADPWIKFAMAELNCGDEDALQEARLAAGDAVRTWRPSVAAFSTHIKNQMRGVLLNWLNSHDTGGVGSRWQTAKGHPVQTVSLNDPVPQDDDDAPGIRQTHLDRLTYDDLDGSTQFERWIANVHAVEELNRMLSVLPSDEAEFFRAVVKAGGQSAFSRASGMPDQTVRDYVARIIVKLAGILDKSCYIQHTTLGNYGRSPSDPDRFVGVGSGDPHGDWAYKPTAADLAAGAAPRDEGYNWSATTRRLFRLRKRKFT